MKLQPLQKNKHYDLRGVSERGLELIEEFCQKDNHTPRLKSIGDLTGGYFVLSYNSGSSFKDEWHIAEVGGKELQEPLFEYEETQDHYNKEELDEYAKELFALCLEKGLDFELDNNSMAIHIFDTREGVENMYEVGNTYICEQRFNTSFYHKNMPIWELIEKVKEL